MLALNVRDDSDVRETDLVLSGDSGVVVFFWQFTALSDRDKNRSMV